MADQTPSYRLWVSEDRTMLVRLWDTGVVEVCTRPHTGAIWGPAVELQPEQVTA